MSERRTFASVTDTECSCEYLSRAANDPGLPIVFDTRTGEYHFTYQEPECVGLSTLVIYHCPFCGGAAPESKRDLLFAVISTEEAERLADLLRPVKSISDALRLLGDPDRDDPHGECISHEEQASQPPIKEYHRMLVYHALSQVAEVWITERPDGTVRRRLVGKPLGAQS